jgi:hypothetical protein
MCGVNELFRDAAPKTVGELIQVEALRLAWQRATDPLARRWAVRQLFQLKGWSWGRWAFVNGARPIGRGV